MEQSQDCTLQERENAVAANHTHTAIANWSLSAVMGLCTTQANRLTAIEYMSATDGYSVQCTSYLLTLV